MAGRGPEPSARTKSHPRRRSPPSTSNSTSRRSIMGPPNEAAYRKGASALSSAVKPPSDVLDRVPVEALVQPARDVADMRRRQQVRQAAERVPWRQRLLVGDIDPCAGDLLIFKRPNEVPLNHPLSPRPVHPPRPRPHEPYFPHPA